MLPDPVPRADAMPYQPYAWPVGAKRQLSPRSHSLELDLVMLVEQRQTRREFGKPLDDMTLGDFLWLACRNRSSRPSRFGLDQESRVHPSAGAMHPVHVLLTREAGPWMRYDPVEHALIELPGSDADATASREAACHLVELDQGTLIALMIEPGKTAAKYSDHESLVWRDAGVVLGYMSLMAEALGLAFCPLGITGLPFRTGCLPNASILQPAGLAIVGKS